MEAVKRAIATVYLALPIGSMQMHTDIGDIDGGDVYMAITGMHSAHRDRVERRG